MSVKITRPLRCYRKIGFEPFASPARTSAGYFQLAVLIFDRPEPIVRDGDAYPPEVL